MVQGRGGARTEQPDPIPQRTCSQANTVHNTVTYVADFLHDIRLKCCVNINKSPQIPYERKIKERYLSLKIQGANKSSTTQKFRQNASDLVISSSNSSWKSTSINKIIEAYSPPYVKKVSYCNNGPHRSEELSNSRKGQRVCESEVVKLFHVCKVLQFFLTLLVPINCLVAQFRLISIGST